VFDDQDGILQEHALIGIGCSPITSLDGIMAETVWSQQAEQVSQCLVADLPAELPAVSRLRLVSGGSDTDARFAARDGG
jgi:hypothetical protein